MITEVRYASLKYKVLWRGIVLDRLLSHLGQGVVVQCVQDRVGFLWGRRVRWQNLLNRQVEVLYAAKFSAACGLSEKFQDLVSDKAAHSLLEHSPLRAVSLELVTAGQSTEEVSVNPALYPAQPMNTILIKAEELVL